MTLNKSYRDIAEKIKHHHVLFLTVSILRGEVTAYSNLDIVVVYKQVKYAYRALWLFFLLVMPSFTGAQTVINGRTVSAHTGLPLDSVRVATRFYTTSTGENGKFFFSLPDTVFIQPETTITELSEYRLRISDKDRLLPYDSAIFNRPYLVNIKGQIIKFRTSSDVMRCIPENSLSPGIYFLYSKNLIAEPLLLTSSSERGYIYKKNSQSIHIRQPEVLLKDTVFFCKDGYKTLAVAVQDLHDGSVIQLFPKTWVSSDFHNHSVLTDGSYTVDTVLSYAFNRYKLDVFVNSEHGGTFGTDTTGAAVIDTQGYSRVMPRWYSLKNQSWPKLMGQRKKYPGKIILQGLEWNCPGHEHASVCFIKDSEQPDAIADFEYQFDANDYDVSRPQLKKQNTRYHSSALAALTWMKKNYPTSSYMFINHPSREAIGRYTISDFRDFHNTAPEVFLGFEGMPGHQKNSIRGSYGYGPSAGNRTWGGADFILANVGGLWDALLGEGRHIWTVVNSDFHYDRTDNWPGEYEKTWTAVTDTGAQAWLDGLRTGEIFITHGELINRLEFSIDDGICKSSMGSDLHSQSTELMLSIRFRSPERNIHGDPVIVDHIDLISGYITGKIDPSNRSAYTNPVNSSTKVIDRFTSKDWVTVNGWNIINKKISCPRPTYFRLRGTNQKVGTSGKIDHSGNPVMDEDYSNSEQIAWKDLWFYSNPIFVYPK